MRALWGRIGAHLDGGGIAVYTTHQAHSLQPKHLHRLDLGGLAAVDADGADGADGSRAALAAAPPAGVSPGVRETARRPRLAGALR